MLVSILAALLTAPAVAYLGANLIEWAAGNEGGIGVFGTAFDDWSRMTIAVIVVGGPAVALALITAAGARFRASRLETGGITAAVEVSVSKTRVRVAVVSALLLVGTIAYWYANNWPCYSNGQFLC